MGIKNWFKRKEDNVLDLRDLQKRGILKENPTETESPPVVDLTNSSSDSSNDSSSALGFLGNLAGASSGSTVSTDPSSVSQTSLSPQKQRLKGILRDLKLNVKSTSDRIYKLSDRLDLIERKLERLERRAGYN